MNPRHRHLALLFVLVIGMSGCSWFHRKKPQPVTPQAQAPTVTPPPATTAANTPPAAPEPMPEKPAAQTTAPKPKPKPRTTHVKKPAPAPTTTTTTAAPTTGATGAKPGEPPKTVAQ